MSSTITLVLAPTPEGIPRGSSGTQRSKVTNPSSVGRNIRGRCVDLNYLNGATHISFERLGRIINGVVEPLGHELTLIAKALNCTVMELTTEV